MERIDALLINPYWSKLSEGIEHLGLGYIAACMRMRGMKVVIVDAPIEKWDNYQTLDKIKNYSPSVIGISIPFQEGALDAFHLIKRIREHFTCHITLGGIYPTFEFEPILKEYWEVDSIILGEGEETFPQLVDTVNSSLSLADVDGIAYRYGEKIITTKKRALIQNLDSLPFPERDTLPEMIKTFNYASIISSRGCYGRCSFCSVDGFYSSFGPKYRFRSPENVVDEIESLYKAYDVHNIMFNDANFIGGMGRGKKRAFAIAQEIKKRKLDIEFRIQCRANDVDEDLFRALKEAGLTRVYIGIESGSQPQLDRYNKDITVEENLKALSILNNLGLFVKIGFIMFDRDVTLDDLVNNTAFINRIRKMFSKDKLGYIYPMSKLIPLSGSLTKNSMLNGNILEGDYKSYTYRFKDKKIELLYNIMKNSSSAIWNIKSRINSEETDTKDWTRGWKEWA